MLESAALSDIGRVSEVIRACQKLGVRFALDDFGTGYASLAYLRRLPADVLKIDQTFVHDMLSDSDDRSIVEGVVSLARTFRRQVIAEGMETPEHGALLIAMGCDLAQGYCVARPMSAAALPGWIEQYSVPPLWNAAARGQFPSEDLSLFSAAIHHWGWCEQVEQACLKTDAGDTDSTLERDSTQCVFGKWFHGQGYQQYGQFD
ncbi:CZB domain-containing protein [Paludibacterium denitrificans]|uniref:CZB domain-containing protein n=1 Tax=Paludibacterium denitrificans TaxID=2675226 RepID=UPI0028AA7F63|nr:EAL domain-containing protein [Paludibacterium denitrificans]